MSGAENLYTACDELLGIASQACALAPGGPMTRVYVSPGPPAWDCANQLTVHAGAAQPGDTAPLQPPLQPLRRIADGREVNLTTLTITALRCVPALYGDGQTPTLPDPADIEAAAHITLGDVWAIWAHISTTKRNGTLFPPNTRELGFDAAIPVITAGGIGGWQIPIRVQVDGYNTLAP